MLALLKKERVRELHLLDNALDKGVKVAALLIVRGADIVYTVI